MQKILIIEDNNVALVYTCEILSMGGYECKGAEEGKTAIEIAQVFMPDLIICDIMMPDMDGYTVFKEVKQIPALASTPFIFLTALAAEGDLRKGMNLGADDYLTKPINADQLVSAVKTRLSKKEKESEAFEHEIKSLQLNISSSIPQQLLSPINNILGIGNLMLLKSRNLDYEDIEKFSSGIINSGEKLLNIIKKFIFYTEVELTLANPAKKAELENKVTSNPDFIIPAMADEMAIRYDRRTDCVIDSKNMTLIIEENHFKIILNELLDNAFKFSSNGDKININLLKADGMAELSLTYKGGTMSEENIRKIGAFRQFDKELQEQEGAGLGLTLVKRITEYYNGLFSISNNEKGLIHVVTRLMTKD